MICKGCGLKAYWIRQNSKGIERCSNCAPAEGVPSMGISTDVAFTGTGDLKTFLKHKEEEGFLTPALTKGFKKTIARFEIEDQMRQKGLEINGMGRLEYDEKCGELHLEADGSTNRPDVRWEVVKDLAIENKEVKMPEGVAP